jgi:hypothetical protein
MHYWNSEHEMLYENTLQTWQQGEAEAAAQ